jgi:hypothetical protein
MLERELKRHAAYFRGWCQPFGEHESIHREDSGVNWLIAENQVGLVLPKSMIKPLYREVLLHSQAPLVTFSHDDVEIGALMLPLDGRHGEKALEELAAMLESGEECHVFLTSKRSAVCVFGSSDRYYAARAGISNSNRVP